MSVDDRTAPVGVGPEGTLTDQKQTPPTVDEYFLGAEWTMCHVLRTTQSDQALIDEVLHATEALHERLGLRYQYRGVQERDDGGRLFTFSETEKRNTRLRVIQDDAAASRYLEIKGPDAQTCWDIGQAISERMTFWEISELIAHARESGLGSPGVLLNVALATPGKVSPEAARLFEEGLRSPDAKIRFAAAIAISVVPEPRFVSALDDALELASDPREQNLFQDIAARCFDAVMPNS
ncbi:MAG: hypothetical protein AAF799_16440 [Myxococcota bacterium]